MSLDTKSLKVGDKVLVWDSGGAWSPRRAEQGIITSISPSGRVSIGEKVFNPNGRERGRGYYDGRWIAPFDQSVLDEQRRLAWISKTRSYLRDVAWKTELSDELIFKIATLVKAERIGVEE